MRPRLLLSIALSLVLAACTSAPTVTEVPVRELAVPAALERSHASVSYSHAVPAADHRPAILVGRSSEAGGPDRPTAWWSTNGVGWTQQPLGVPQAGRLVDLDADGDALHAYVAGSTWSQGVTSLWVQRHVAGGEWEVVDLPDAVPAGATLEGLAVVGGEPVLVVEDVDGGWHAVRAGREPSVTALPGVDDGTHRDVTSVVAAGDGVVVLAREGARGSARPTVAYRSPDRGTSWREPVQALTPDQGVTGTAAHGVGFVATGWTRTDPAAPQRPAVWRSVDGLSWTAEAVVIPERLQERLSRSDVTLASPTAGLALLTLDDIPHLLVMRRNGDRWVELGATARTHTTSPSGVLAVVDERVAVGVSGRDAGVIGSLPLLTDGDWVVHAANAEPVDVASVHRVDEGPDGTVVTTHARLQTVTTDTWSIESRTEQRTLDGTGIGDPLSRPAQATEASTPMTAYDEDGASVLLVPDDFRDDGILAWSGWLTPAGGEPRTFTLPTAGGDWVYDVTAAGPGWVAVGSTRAKATFSTEPRPAAWSSVDGTTWTPAALPLPEEVADADIDALCRWDDRTALAVGGGNAASGGTLPLAWAVDAAGVWTSVDPTAFGTGADLTACADGGDRVAVVGSVDGRGTVWELTPDGAATVVHQVDDGERVDDVVLTPSGPAVVGTVREKDWTGGVLDTQVEGEWVRTRIPVGDSSRSTVALVGGVLQTYWQTPTGAVGFGVDLTDLVGDA